MMDITRENNCLWDFFWVKNSWMEFRTIMELGKLLKKTFGYLNLSAFSPSHAGSHWSWPPDKLAALLDCPLGA